MTDHAMPRIRLVAASLGILGGQGVEADLLIKALRQDGYRVRFVPVDARLLPGLGWTRRVPILRTIVNELHYLVSLIRTSGADVTHAFSASYWSFLLAPVPAMLAGRLAGHRVILHYHSGEAADHLARWGWLVHPWLRLAHEIVVPSEFLRRVFEAHGHQVRVIANIVELSGYRFRTREPLRPRLVSVRNLEPYYRVDTILRAFPEVCRRYPDATLTVAGVGSEAAALNQLARSIGQVGIRFVGRVEPAAMPAFYDAHDIFVNTSTLDNQPVSLLEAAAAGVPIVTTAPGDIPAMVEDGVSARFVAPDNPQALAEAVLECLEAPGAAQVRAERARARIDRHTWPSVRSAWADAYACPAAEAPECFCNESVK